MARPEAIKGILSITADRDDLDSLGIARDGCVKN
jgi:hypothetical protein